MRLTLRILGTEVVAIETGDDTVDWVQVEPGSVTSDTVSDQGTEIHLGFTLPSTEWVED